MRSRKRTHMQILASFCLVVFFCYVIEFYGRFLLMFLGSLVMECASHLKFLTQECQFGGGFLVFGCFSQLFNVLGLFFMLGLGLKVLQSGWHSKGLRQYFGELRGKSSELRNGFCFRDSSGRLCDSKIMSCTCDSVKFLEKSSSVKSKDFLGGDCDHKANGVLEEYCDGKEMEPCEEDNEFDVLALRKLVKMQRRRANAALAELEKERLAAASAADEAMAMILRLQNEKSSVEIEANQYRRLAEQKQQYDQEVIQSLQWIVMKHESDGSLLDDIPSLYRKKLKQFTEGEENLELCLSGGDDSNTRLLGSLMEESFDDVPISSLDYDTSVQ